MNGCYQFINGIVGFINGNINSVISLKTEDYIEEKTIGARKRTKKCPLFFNKGLNLIFFMMGNYSKWHSHNRKK